MAEKMRVHILAKELNVPSKVIIEKCKAEGVTSVKNHMSTLSAGLHATICEWFSEGSHSTTLETSERVNLKEVRLKEEPQTAISEVAEAPTEGAAVAVMAAERGSVVAELQGAPPAASTVTRLAPSTATDAPPAEEMPEEPLQEAAEADAVVVSAEAPATSTDTDQPAEPPQESEDSTKAEPAVRAPVNPAGPQNVPGKAKLQGPRVVRYEALDYDVRPPVRRRPPDAARPTSPGPFPAPSAPVPSNRPADRGAARRKGRASPRRSAGQLVQSGERLAEWRDLDLQERRERLAGATGRRALRRRSGQRPGAHPIDTGPKTQATVNEPVRMKDFCSATGLNFMQCFRILKDEHGIVANVNMTLPTETAELLGLHVGIELTVVPAKTLLDELQEEFAARERKHEQPRPPVVTMLGHVDHGKTSLLDAIRATHVASGEDGGITQHIGAYHIETPGGKVTFLDTPGHKAFTAMRARGANLTDIVVLVIAADDGVMPQTLEAINHAKAAKVPVVVALNKIDLGDQNQLKIFGQLAEHGLTPSGDWGGEVDVIPTSATQGTGVQELIEHLSELSALLDLKADPTLPAAATVIEAETKQGVGPVARVLVQEGSLRTGDVVVCGPAFGRVRALLTDRGARVKEAGPSIPVEVWGLDEVPAASDRLYRVKTLHQAKSIAEETKQSRRTGALAQSRKVNTLEEMFLQRDDESVSVLNVIIKGDMEGSLAALRQALGDFPSEEVRLSIRHAGVGAVNDSDVLLAAACRGIVIAYRVELSTQVRRLADHHGVDVRPYRVIYDVHDDIKKALEGLLAPEERFEPRGAAEVREIFRLSRKAGVVAGSFVTENVLNRTHLGKIIRNGTVIREGCKFLSLRRFKDDVKEVRAGMECGIRFEGFDDVHVGDTIETYEIVKIARTLS